MFFPLSIGAINSRRRRLKDHQSSDPYWDNVVLLLRGNGINDSTDFVDESLANHQMYSVGVTNSTDASLFSSTSLKCRGGSSTHIMCADSSFLVLPNDFTIELFINYVSFGGMYLSKWDSGDQEFSLIEDASRISLGWGAYNPNAVSYPLLSFATSSLSRSLGTWYHVAATRSGDEFRLFFDGVLKNTATFAGAANGTSGLYIGNYIDGGYAINGYLDSIRITKGVARYTEDFTPPAEPFPTQ